jgi:hypothetical protein
MRSGKKVPCCTLEWDFCIGPYSVAGQSRTQSNACARARMALALGKLNFSCAVIGLMCMPTKPGFRLSISPEPMPS